MARQLKLIGLNMANSGVNKVILVGRLGDDPTIKYTAQGSAVTNITLATSESWIDKQSGQKKESTEWHRVVLFGKLAEVAGEYLRKGSQVYIEGQLRTRKWQDQQGQDRYTTEIVVNVGGTMQMLGGKQEGGQGNKPPQQQRQQPQRQAGPSTPPPMSEPPMDFDDDIPFAPIGLQHPTHFIYSI